MFQACTRVPLYICYIKAINISQVYLARPNFVCAYQHYIQFTIAKYSTGYSRKYIYEFMTQTWLEIIKPIYQANIHSTPQSTYYKQDTNMARKYVGKQTPWTAKLPRHVKQKLHIN